MNIPDKLSKDLIAFLDALDMADSMDAHDRMGIIGSQARELKERLVKESIEDVIFNHIVKKPKRGK